jgi:hypothetical protein
MTRRAQGFATLAAVAIFVLVIALISGAVLGSQQLALDQDRLGHEIDSRASAWKSIDTTLSSMQTSWNADDQSFDAWFTEKAQSLPAGVKLASLSGRINLNSITPFLLQYSALSGTLVGHSVTEFTDYRMNKGPFARLEDYKDYFRPESLKRLYCVYSSFDVNTADEIILEKIITQRTGKSSLGANVRARVREFRTGLQVMTDSDWDRIIGAEKDELGDIVSVSPELDVNTASVDVLQALLRDADFKLEQPDAKVQTIINGRTAKPWTDDALRQALGLTKTSALMQHLGTRCRFVEGSVPAGDRVMSFVVHLTYSKDASPRIIARIVETSSEARP